MEKEPRLFVGADPDMHSQSIVVIDENGILKKIAIVKVHRRITGQEAIIAMAGELADRDFGAFRSTATAIESQEIAYTAREGRNPRSLLMLANVSGILLAQAARVCVTLYLPTPQAWKGSISKKIHQARVCKKMGWEFVTKSDYVIPSVDLSGVEVTGKLNSSDWKHILDSVGLALYARDTFLKAERRNKILQEINHDE